VNAPVDAMVDPMEVELIVPPVIVAELVVKDVTFVDPAYKAPPIPTPPATTNAPVKVDVDRVEAEI